MADKVEKAEKPQLAKHDASVLDLVFAMDCTGSMASYIQAATESIRGIVEEIVALEKSDIKLALVEYRDHPPQETTFVTRKHDFTDSVKTMKSWLEQCSAIGGGDEPEAVADALHDVLNLTWREKSTKICVLISDAPPHGLNQHGDSFPNGCPNNIDPVATVKKMAEKGITLYCVGCEPSLLPYKSFFAGLAYTTGGQYVPLRNAKLLAQVIVGGAVEEISLDRLMDDVEKEVEEQRKQGITDEKVMAANIQAKLAAKGVVTNQLKLNDADLEKASEKAIKYSKMSNLAEIRTSYKTDEVPAGAGGGGGARYGLHSLRSSSVAAADAPAGGAESYSVSHDVINSYQAERLVQKVKAKSHRPH